MKHVFLHLWLLLSPFLIWQLSIAPAYAQWSTDPNTNNVICNAPLDQLYPKIVTDGSGGAIITWNDMRNGTSDANIYAQRIDSSGYLQWTTNGAAICDTTRNQIAPALTSDGAGGAILAWEDYRTLSNSYDIYAQTIDSSGVAQWTANGVAICTTIDYQYTPHILSDDSGGAIVTWHDFRQQNAVADIFAQKISSSGLVQWTANGVAVCLATGDETNLAMTGDGLGGAIAVWQDTRQQVGGLSNIYAQRISSSGAMLWTPNGVALTYQGITCIYPTIASDGSGGAIIAWSDWRNDGNGSVYAQRIDSSGVVQWAANGVDIGGSTYNQVFPVVVSHASGDAIIAWEDWRQGSYPDVYAQRIDSSGLVQWDAGGVALCTAAYGQFIPTIARAGSGGAVVTWRDLRAGGAYGDIYAQRIDSSGAGQWTADGVAVSTAPRNQSNPTIVSDGSSGALITWGDLRGGSYSDVYAQQVNANGSLGLVTSAVGEPGLGMERVALRNCPNPFRSSTVISWQHPIGGSVSLKIYDVLGNEVAVLMDRSVSAGGHATVFEASGLTSGIYFCRLQSGTLTVNKKMVLLESAVR